MTPAVVLGVPVLLVASPLAFAATLVTDLLTGPRRLRFTRLLGMALNYAVCEWIGVIVAFLLWIATGFGIAMQRPWSRRAHYAVQRWWGGAVFAAAERWLGVRVEIDSGELVRHGPFIIAARHASFIDALLPTILLSAQSPALARHVLKQELAWDPCLNIYGHRHPNHFVERGAADRTTELTAIEALAATSAGEALVIFPEGTFRSAARASRVLERFAEREPDRAARLDLRHLLPPRPGGISALMQGCPEADLVLVAHTGFEPFGSFRAIIDNVPFSAPVRIKLWRVPADDIPDEADARLALIDDWWQRMDDWIEESAAADVALDDQPDRGGRSISTGVRFL